MSKQLHNFISNVLKMTHHGNDHAGSGQKFNSHEDALANELLNSGYSEIQQHSTRINRNGKIVRDLTFPHLKRDALKRAIFSKNRQREIGKLVSGLMPGQFIRQPVGSQSFPDFLICDFSGKFVIVEAKSGNKTVPAWNDSLVKKNAIYIFSSGHYNETTVFLGQDVLDEAREQFLIKQYEKIRQIIEETQTELSNMNDALNRGFSLSYARPKFEQSGGKHKVDYFIHTDRKKCEQNVLKFALEQ